MRNADAARLYLCARLTASSSGSSTEQIALGCRVRFLRRPMVIWRAFRDGR